MANWAAAMGMRRLLLGGGWKYCHMTTTAAEATRFHPDIGGRMSIITRGGGGGKSPLPLLMVPPDMLTDYTGGGGGAESFIDYASHYYNFISIEKPQDGEIHRKLITLEKSNKLPWEKLLLPDDAICRGSSHGWLAFVHPTTREVGLFNPFLHSSSKNNKGYFPYIPLPPSDTIKDLHCEHIYKADYLSITTPLIRERIFDCYLFRKFALSSAPPREGYEDDQCNVVAISDIHKRLVSCKLGDSVWTNLKGSFLQYSDVIYFSKHRLFYAVREDMHEYPYHDPFEIESWDFTTDPCSPNNTLIQPSMDSIPSTIKQFPLNPQGWRAKKKPLTEDGQLMSGLETRRYLVEASGDLLLVLRVVAEDIDKDGFLGVKLHWDQVYKERDWNYGGGLRYRITVGFAVYKMDWNDNKWEPVESLGDKALFVGLNHSFSISIHDLPQVMENSIYFTDDTNFWYNPHRYDTGVYHMEDAYISGILPSSLEVTKHFPLWVLPNPN